ncbi:MAG TPA: helix-turn-helix transcriptional regulator [Opitutaceae bacterium]
MTRPSSSRLLASLVKKLPHPAQPLLHGRRSDALVLPENLACFQRSNTAELNQPARGRALHHRCVLIVPLKGAVPMFVDDREFHLRPPHGLLVLPFQFHHYLPAEKTQLHWLFITFEYSDIDALQDLRFQPFKVTPEIRQLLVEFVQAYQTKGTTELPVLLLAVLLSRLRQSKFDAHTPKAPPGAPSFVTQVNLLVHRSGSALGVKELARDLGISTAHLRARFRASCGVSIGRHLRRLRLERACGLLRMSNARVSEIAEKCGFNSVFSFSRAFHATYGVSPMQYRKGSSKQEEPIDAEIARPAEAPCTLNGGIGKGVA